MQAREITLRVHEERHNRTIAPAAGPSDVPDLVAILTEPRSDFAPVLDRYRATTGGGGWYWAHWGEPGRRSAKAAWCDSESG